MFNIQILANLSDKVTLYTDKGVVEEGPNKEGPKYKMFGDHLYYARPQLKFYRLIILNMKTNKTVVTDFEFSKDIWLKNKSKLIDGHNLEMVYGK